MAVKIGFALLWLAFLLYAFLLAPPNNPHTLNLIQDLSFFETEGINPIIVSLFNLMGILPLMYLPLLLVDGKGQKLPAWLFAVVSFGVGAFAILPYLALREPPARFPGEKNWLLKVLDSRLLGILLSTVFVVVLIGGLLAGDWGDFFRQWQTSRFINVMSLDFCLLVLLFPALLQDDSVRRGVGNSQLLQALLWVPLIGPLLYFCIRPPLPETDAVGEGTVTASGDSSS
jgi:hypothetical protein